MLAIINGKLLTITNGVIENGTILVENGKITAVGADVQVPAGAEVIDAAGKWVMPGLVDAHTHLASHGEPSTRPGPNPDHNERINPVTPAIHIRDSIYPRSRGIGLTRAAGFTTCGILPGSSNLIGGLGAAFKMKDVYTVEEMLVPGTEVMKMALGENPLNAFGGKGKAPVTRMGVAGIFREVLTKAKMYADKKAKGENVNYDHNMEALVPVVRGEMLCRIHCHRVDDIATALRIVDEFGLKACLEHCTEGFLIPELIAQKKVPVVVGPLCTTFSKAEIWNRNFGTPAVLAKAGVPVSLTQDADCMTRILPAMVGMTIAQGGLDEETAFKAMTITPAQVLGMADRIGSLEVGKDADIAIFTGHPFSSLSRCTHTIIEGEVFEN